MDLKVDLGYSQMHIAKPRVAAKQHLKIYNRAKGRVLSCIKCSIKSGRGRKRQKKPRQPRNKSKTTNRKPEQIWHILIQLYQLRYLQKTKF